MSGHLIERLDVEHCRRLEVVTLFVRQPLEALLVLGSGQPATIVRHGPRTPRVARRRGGGGAVLVDPSRTVWMDVWIPVTSSLHTAGARAALTAIGGLWCEALLSLGAQDLSVADPPRAPAPSPACFATIGYGEVVTSEERKLVGLTAWRAREGDLVQGAVYANGDPTALIEHLELSDHVKDALSEQLAQGTTDLARALPRGTPLDTARSDLVRVLIAALERADASDDAPSTVTAPPIFSAS